jgi:hypothetical protein
VKTHDDGQRNCQKHVEFYSKNKFEKLLHLFSFIIGTKVTLLQTKSQRQGLDIFVFHICHVLHQDNDVKNTVIDWI